MFFSPDDQDMLSSLLGDSSHTRNIVPPGVGAQKRAARPPDDDKGADTD